MVFLQERQRKNGSLQMPTMVVGVILWLVLARCSFRLGIASRVLERYRTLSRRIVTAEGERKVPLNYRPTSCGYIL
jgi:hypothetical protein